MKSDLELRLSDEGDVDAVGARDGDQRHEPPDHPCATIVWVCQSLVSRLKVYLGLRVEG